MKLLKTTILSFLSTAIKVSSGLIVNKIVAIYGGPTGIALLGQLQNFMQMAMTLGKGGINNGVVKYCSENLDNKEEIRRVITTSLLITLISSLVVSLFILIFSNYLTKYIFNSEEYELVFLIFGSLLILISMNQLVLSLLNGLKKIEQFIAINIIQSLIMAVTTVILVYFYGMKGALISLAVNQAIVVVVVVPFILRGKDIFWLMKGIKLDISLTKKLLSFSFMALTTAIVSPATQLLIRQEIGNEISWESAGYWQATNYISSVYILLLTTAMSTYFLPQFSSAKNKSSIISEFNNGCILVVCILIPMFFVLYIFRYELILLIFDKTFKPISELLLWQFLADFVKSLSWLFGFFLIAKAQTKVVVITEIIFSLLLYFITVYFLDIFDLLGGYYAFTIVYTIHLLVMLLLCIRYIRNEYA